ncbi:MAG: glycosyltransferase [Cryomorphaceae bacterium]|nr:MAG: glycosyltransferase [Cryomorphaceae bacterium]
MQKICVVIPCYNEASRLPVQEIKRFVAQAKPGIHLLLVNDGSTDQTAEVTENLSRDFPDRIRTLNLETNSGKAEAVRQGALFCLSWKEFDGIAYFDADLSTPLNELSRLQTVIIQNPDCAFVFGARIKLLGNQVHRNLTRHYFGRVFSTLASMILGLPVYDTQCGAKLLRASLVEVVFSKSFLSRWLFDIEVFARIVCARGYAYALGNMREVPLETWIEKGDSRITFTYLLKVPFELLRIYFNYRPCLRAARNKTYES